jgi:uracil-DNA glycosylase
MLNTCLTVKASEAGSHSKKGWEQFTENVINVVDQYGGANLPVTTSGSGSESTGVGRGIVFIAWGAWASERVSKLSKVSFQYLSPVRPDY